MKKLLTLLLMLCFFITNAQFEQGKIYLNDGSTKTGLIKERDLGGIKYKEKEESDVELYDHTSIDGYDITENGIVKYRYKKTENGFPQIMQIVRVGKINLYSIKVANRDITTGIRVNYSFIYFIEKDNVTTRVGKKLSKSDLELFNDCPSLIKKIKKKEFKKNDVYQIVNFYDMNCS
ncbi:hypothetical protein [Thalassobellus suaedae]|uniref:Uncharacterized protein n=1 Tax=Thalassobellus suaedae TaxID=3074124 RepID=A0ABY9XZ06_9FLAO|nr:hypothetical protein RHP51_09590 [Flavobacteriaceae bacterium HL-DH14]